MTGAARLLIRLFAPRFLAIFALYAGAALFFAPSGLLRFQALEFAPVPMAALWAGARFGRVAGRWATRAERWRAALACGFGAGLVTGASQWTALRLGFSLSPSSFGLADSVWAWLFLETCRALVFVVMCAVAFRHGAALTAPAPSDRSDAFR